MKVTKYSYPPRACILNGPHTSECTSSSNSVALRPLAEKGHLVIFPSIQDSQVGNDPIAEAVDRPSQVS